MTGTDVQQARIEAAAKALFAIEEPDRNAWRWGKEHPTEGLAWREYWLDAARAALAAADAVVTVESIIGVLDHEGAQCGNCGREPGDPADCTDCARVLARYAAAIQRLYRGEEHHND